jgi:outer membrane murein-binding lipoprotein Lpp
MKKSFIKLMFCSLLAVASTTFVGCKDYDDDINNQQTQINQLSSQLTALETALNKAQSDATAAGNAAAAAQKAADEAAQQAALAQQAAATAKAEAIQEVINQLRPLIDANTAKITENANQIAAILGRIDGIDSSLRNVQLQVDENTASITALTGEVNTLKTTVANNTEAITALNAQLQAIDTQIRALEIFKENASDRLDKIEAAIADLQSIRDRVAAVEALAQQNKADISTLKQKVADNTQDILDIAKEVSKINNAVNTIANTLTRRLTSVTLIPDLYIDGIPSIEFKSAKYTVLELKNGEYVATDKTEIVTNGTAIAEYRLNPSNVGLDDIDASGLKFVTKVATSRADDVDAELINVVPNSASVTDGVLSLKLGKATTAALLREDGKINTVALKVPIAKEHLFDGEAAAAVYSEYSRLDETTFEPRLSFYGNDYDKQLHLHLYTKAEAYASAENELVATEIPYNVDTFDLYSIVEGCEYVADAEHPLLTRDELKAYGLDIEFSVPEQAYNLNSVNQQTFAKIEDGKVIPQNEVLYGANGIAGKQPIILAKLYNTTTNAVVDARYFKIRFSAVPAMTYDIAFDDITVTSACDDALTVKNILTWKDFDAKVLSKINKDGMTRADFVATYDQVVPTPVNEDNKVVSYKSPLTDTDKALVWTIVPDVTKVGTSEFSFKYTVTYRDQSGLNGDVILNLTGKVIVKLTPATLGESHNLKYVDGTMKVYPVPMAIPYDGTSTADYKTNILEGRYVDYVQGLSACDLADVDYASHGTKYVGEDFTFDGISGHWAITKTNQPDIKAIYYTLANTEEGQKLIHDGETITLDWNQRYAGRNDLQVLVGNTKLKLVPILTLNSTTAETIEDNSRAVTIDLESNYSMKDAFGNEVANTSGLPKDYYTYYGVQAATFDGEIYVADDAAGKVNPTTLEKLNMTANVSGGGQLTFQNNGAPLQADAYLIVPIQVKHKWGSFESTQLKGTIAVPLKKSSAPLNKRNK